MNLFPCQNAFIDHVQGPPTRIAQSLDENKVIRDTFATAYGRDRTREL